MSSPTRLYRFPKLLIAMIGWGLSLMGPATRLSAETPPSRPQFEDLALAAIAFHPSIIDESDVFFVLLARKLLCKDAQGYFGVDDEFHRPPTPGTLLDFRDRVRDRLTSLAAESPKTFKMTYLAELGTYDNEHRRFPVTLREGLGETINLGSSPSPTCGVWRLPRELDFTDDRGTTDGRTLTWAIHLDQSISSLWMPIDPAQAEQLVGKNPLAQRMIRAELEFQIIGYSTFARKDKYLATIELNGRVASVSFVPINASRPVPVTGPAMPEVAPLFFGKGPLPSALPPRPVFPSQAN